MDRCVLGLDLGQSGVRAAVVDRAGALRGHARRDLPPVSGGPGRAEHDPAVLLATAFGAARAAVAAGRAGADAGIEGVCVEAFGPAPTLLDAGLAPLTPTLLYRLDARCEGERAAMAAEAGLAPGALGRDHALPKLRWWRHNAPEVWDRAACVVDAAGLVVAHLTGRPFMDALTRAEYYEHPALPATAEARLLPDTLAATDVAGPLLPGAADRLGVRSGVPVLAGSIDSFVDLRAAGLTGPGQAGIVCGSTGVAAVAVDGAVPTGHGLVESGHLGPGRLLADWTGTSTAAVEWARDLLGVGGEVDLDAAALPPGASGVLALPRLAASAAGPTGGVLAGLTTGTTSAEVYRAVVDGVAVELASVARAAARLGVRVDEWSAWGGGFAIPALRQALADAVGAPLVLRAPAGRAVAAADLAREVLLGSGPRPVLQVVEPDPATAAAYARLALDTDALTRALSTLAPDTPDRRS